MSKAKAGEIPHLKEADSPLETQNRVRQKTPVTDSASNPLTQAADQAAAGLDNLLTSLRSDDEEKPKKRGRKKKEPPAKDFKAALWASPNDEGPSSSATASAAAEGLSGDEN